MPRFTNSRGRDPRSELRLAHRKDYRVWDWFALAVVAMFIAIIVVAGKHNQSSTEREVAAISSNTNTGSTSPQPPVSANRGN